MSVMEQIARIQGTNFEEGCRLQDAYRVAMQQLEKAARESEAAGAELRGSVRWDGFAGQVVTRNYPLTQCFKMVADAEVALVAAAREVVRVADAVEKEGAVVARGPNDLRAAQKGGT